MSRLRMLNLLRLGGPRIDLDFALLMQLRIGQMRERVRRQERGRLLCRGWRRGVSARRLGCNRPLLLLSIISVSEIQEMGKQKPYFSFTTNNHQPLRIRSLINLKGLHSTSCLEGRPLVLTPTKLHIIR